MEIINSATIGMIIAIIAMSITAVGHLLYLDHKDRKNGIEPNVGRLRPKEIPGVSLKGASSCGCGHHKHKHAKEKHCG